MFPDYYTAKEAAKKLKTSYHNFRNIMIRRSIGYYVIGGEYRIPIEEFELYLKNNYYKPLIPLGQQLELNAENYEPAFSK